MQPLNLRDVGLAHRLLNWAVFASFFLIYSPYFVFVVMPFSLYCIWRISSALQLNTLAKNFCLLLSIIPLINIILLFVLNGMATRVLGEAGIRVGLMGVNINDLKENHIQQPTKENHIQPLTSKEAEENARELEKLDQEWEEMWGHDSAPRFVMLEVIYMVICIVGLGLVGFGVWLLDNEMFLVKMFPRLIGARLIENICDQTAQNVSGWLICLGIACIFGSLMFKTNYVNPKYHSFVDQAKSYHFLRQELLEEIATSVRSENSRNEEHKPPD